MKPSSLLPVPFAVFAPFAAIVACSSSSVSTANDDAGSATDAASTSDAITRDAGQPQDTGSSSVDASAGAACTFNRDCIASQRCECDETAGCFCADGARGTGQNGIDPCTTGDDCTSALCVEGPDGGSFCSDECSDPSGCTGALPLCEDIATLGMVCVRQP